MSKAEERANEKYPLMQEGDQEGLEALKYIGMECDSVYEFNSVRYSQQVYFIEGYHQAEKDLELTWADIKIILDIEIDILRECNNQKELVIKTYPKGEDYYGEILKRFNDLKK
jgi:hypothetical protein